MTRTLRKFARDERGSEMMEFALVLALFSIIAIGGWGIVAGVASDRQTTMQNNLSNTAMYPP